MKFRRTAAVLIFNLVFSFVMVSCSRFNANLFVVDPSLLVLLFLFDIGLLYFMIEKNYGKYYFYYITKFTQNASFIQFCCTGSRLSDVSNIKENIFCRFQTRRGVHVNF